MEQNKHFEMRYPKLVVEAIIRSLLSGLCVGFGANFVLGAVFWIIGTENLPLVIGCLCGTLAVVTLAAAAVFYFTRFKPTIANNARRIDKLGLEERAVTMIDYKDDDSVMAKLQREDALQALNVVDAKALKILIGRKIVASLLICGLPGAGMTTVASLSAAGLLPSGSELIDKAIPDEPPVYIPVSYVVEEGGLIEGETEQLVLMGDDAAEVIAIPDEGYTFEGWDDGYAKPSRQDKKIDHPLVLTAIFEPIDEEGDDDDEGDQGDNGTPSDEQEGQSGDSGGDQQGEQEGEEGEESDQLGEGAGKYNKVNQIIDGNTYYREFLEEYKETIMELLKKKAEELTEEEKALIEAYINIV